MKKKFCTILLIIIMIFGISVQAKGTNGFYADDSVSLKKKFDTTTFIAGNNVDVSSEIEGINFVAGNNINLSSKQDYLFVAGNSIDVRNVEAKDAFIAGATIRVKESTIRDLYVAGETVTIDSNISRNLYAAGETVTLNSEIKGDVKLSAETIIIGENAIISGTINYPDDASININDSAKIGKTKTYKSHEIEKTSSIASTIGDKILSFISILVVSLVLLLLNKKMFTGIEKLDRDAKNTIKMSLIGFLALITIPMAALFIMITVIGIPISIIGIIFYGILIYLSNTASSYYVGNWMLKDKIKNKYLLLTVSLLCLYIVKALPIIGGYVSFISLCLGLGIYTMLIKRRINEK